MPVVQSKPAQQIRTVVCTPNMEIASSIDGRGLRSPLQETDLYSHCYRYCCPLVFTILGPAILAFRSPRKPRAANTNRRPVQVAARRFPENAAAVFESNQGTT